MIDLMSISLSHSINHSNHSSITNHSHSLSSSSSLIHWFI